MYLGASQVDDATKALNSVNELMKAADPFMKMALTTFKTAVSVNPGMLDSALSIVPEPMKSQIKASLVDKPAKEKSKSASTQSAAPTNWTPWYIGGGVLAALAVGVAVVRRKKK